MLLLAVVFFSNAALRYARAVCGGKLCLLMRILSACGTGVAGPRLGARCVWHVDVTATLDACPTLQSGTRSALY